jgi:hypothetical protein
MASMVAMINTTASVNSSNIKTRIRALSIEAKIKLKEQKELSEVYLSRRQEANKVYILGLKDYLSKLKISGKINKIDKTQIEKLREMLMDHHMNRLHKINE